VVIPAGTLDNAVDSLIDNIRRQIFDNKPKLDAEDTVQVDGRAEVSYTSLQKLRQGEWWDNWILMAGIQMSDKPFFVTYGQCIPLGQPEASGRGNKKVKQVYTPFARWRETIESNPLHGLGLLVHLLPLNLENRHFTLLEVNEKQRRICHYDSNAPPQLISGSGRAIGTRVRKLVFVSIGL
jgi:hypothetical protein